MPYADRRDAGSRLGADLARRRWADPLVLALPRGGVPVAYEVARAIDAPLDVLVVRKLGCPGHAELGVGAIAEGGVRLRNEPLLRRLGIGDAALERVARSEEAELARRLDRYRGGRPASPPSGRTVVLVDDGLATGFTARAAAEVVRRRGAARVVLAVPVAPADTLDELVAIVDEVVCLETPAWFTAIGEFYADFSPTTDAEVGRLLEAAARSVTRRRRSSGRRIGPGP